MEKLSEQSCNEFAAALASKEPVPGGGGAAALMGTLGTALCSMVGNFTVGNSKYAGVEMDVKSILQKASHLQKRLLQLIDEDARAFIPLAHAYSIPKDNSERRTLLESATLNACKAPLEIIQCCCNTIDLLDEMQRKGNSMLLSDVGCGAAACRACLESAALNVFVNTGTLKDRTQASELEADANALLTRYIPKTEQILEAVKFHIQKER